MRRWTLTPRCPTFYKSRSAAFLFSIASILKRPSKALRMRARIQVRPSHDAVSPPSSSFDLHLAGSVGLFRLMAMRWKLWKCLLLILLLGGDLGHSPASLEAHLPRVSPQNDQTNILFAPQSFFTLDSRYSYSAMATIFGMLLTPVVGMMLIKTSGPLQNNIMSVVSYIKSRVSRKKTNLRLVTLAMKFTFFGFLQLSFCIQYQGLIRGGWNGWLATPSPLAPLYAIYYRTWCVVANQPLQYSLKLLATHLAKFLDQPHLATTLRGYVGIGWGLDTFGSLLPRTLGRAMSQILVEYCVMQAIRVAY